MRALARGLAFPEGPVALDDGSVLVAEIAGGTLACVAEDGQVERVADCGGGPNGAAIGPDGKVYVCNNGGMAFREHDGVTVAQPTPAEQDIGGRIQVVDLATGSVDDLYVACGGEPLKGPNDIVFDDRGGFYFTDYGKNRGRWGTRGGLYYGTTDGAELVELVFPLPGGPNGIGLSPDGRRLLVAETWSARILSFAVERPGQLGDVALFGTVPGLVNLDSLAVEAGGDVAVATVFNPRARHDGITVMSPKGDVVQFVEVPARGVVTNVCFGGPERRDAYITASGDGVLFHTTWERPGLAPAYSAG